MALSRRQFLFSSRPCLLAAIASAMVLGLPRHAGADPSVESRVKAAFILNFMQFIDWPASAFAKPDDPIIIGVLDPDPLEGALASAVDGKTVRGRKVIIRHFGGGPIAGCHLLVTGGASADKLPELLKSINQANILTIGDTDDFTDAGGIIRFYVDDRKERFEINLTAAERAHLQISSKLLKLARVVNK